MSPRWSLIIFECQDYITIWKPSPDWKLISDIQTNATSTIPCSSLKSDVQSRNITFSTSVPGLRESWENRTMERKPSLGLCHRNQDCKDGRLIPYRLIRRFSFLDFQQFNVYPADKGHLLQTVCFKMNIL